jgi:D-beta-D-heptose 7-phosphate kinase/D-beta-D-heptose 1-phosphate adenosyltransferase
MIAYPDFRDCSVLVIGDIILDSYLWGDVDRLSPEAPVPVVNVSRKTTNSGGAGNVAMNLKGLGCHHTLIGTRGDDTNGTVLLEILNQEKIENFILTIPGHPTTTKTRIIGQNQQLVRLDEEDLNYMTDCHNDTLVQHINKRLPDADVVILSDYGKGLLTPELTRQIISQCNAENIPVFIDPKGVSWEKYQSATVITPNSTEFNLVAPYSETDPATLERQAEKLLHQLNLEYLLVTRGAKGMSLLQKNGDMTHIPAKAREVFDVSGAGDTVIAAVAAAFGAGISMDQAAAFANVAAGIVIGKLGTQAIQQVELKQSLSNSSLALENKIVSKNYACDRIAHWRSNGSRIVFTNGCFDILHVGHIKLLHAAAREGDKLIVGLNSDNSVKHLKGEQRPIIPEEERAALLSNIKGVDLVVLFNQATPIELIEAFAPDVIVKGGDYTPETVVGHEVVQEYGGKVVIVPLVQGVSSTRVIESIDTSQITR